MLMSSQLAFWAPIGGLKLCRRLLDLMEGHPDVTKPLSGLLTGARLSFVQGNNVYLTFEPFFGSSASDDYAVAIVAQFICNYVAYVSAAVSDEFRLRLKGWTLITILQYLREALGKEAARHHVDVTRYNSAVHGSMVEYSLGFYANWAQGAFPEEQFPRMIMEARHWQRELWSQLGVSRFD